jgi:hypothetical protein
MHRIINVNAAVKRPTRGALFRSRQQGGICVASRPPLRAWMTLNGCLLTYVAHTAPSRASRIRAFSSLSSPNALSKSYVHPSTGRGAICASQLGLRSPLGHFAASRLPKLQPRVVQLWRSFHASNRNEGHPLIPFLVPLLKASTSLAVIKTGAYYIESKYTLTSFIDLVCASRSSNIIAPSRFPTEKVQGGRGWFLSEFLASDPQPLACRSLNGCGRPCLARILKRSSLVKGRT